MATTPKNLAPNAKIQIRGVRSTGTEPVETTLEKWIDVCQDLYPDMPTTVKHAKFYSNDADDGWGEYLICHGITPIAEVKVLQ